MAKKKISKKKKTEEDKPYTVGKWKGFDNYECKLCPFSTLHENVMKEHIFRKHGPKPQASVQGRDRFGNMIH